MLSIIYPYRNRDLERLKNSLESLKQQSVTNFEVFFVDYGSEKEKAIMAKELCGEYDFLKYSYHHTQHQPWNKSRALNSVIKNLKTDFCFVADVDMIFHVKFVEKALKLQERNRAVYFQVGFLEKGGIRDKNFTDLKSYRKSTEEATGLTMFPVKALQELRGFDEFYHFWGAEDTDMHVRLNNSGRQVEFYDKEVLLLHQWHLSYRNTEVKSLTRKLQLSGIVQLNHRHLNFARDEKTTLVNPSGWGNCMMKKEEDALEQAPLDIILDNEQHQIDDLLYGQLPAIKNRCIKIRIRKAAYLSSYKFYVKKVIGQKVQRYYSLKEVNDKLLMHLISFYRNCPYTYKVSNDLQEIEVAIEIKP